MKEGELLTLIKGFSDKSNKENTLRVNRTNSMTSKDIDRTQSFKKKIVKLVSRRPSETQTLGSS